MIIQTIMPATRVPKKCYVIETPRTRRPTFSGRSTDKSSRMIYEAGKTAYRAGKPLFANPHVGAPGRLWSHGWRGIRYRPGEVRKH